MTEEQINRSLSSNFLALDFGQFLGHYLIVGLFGIGTLSCLFLLVTELLQIPPGLGQLPTSAILIIFFICLTLSITFGILQRKRLRLELISPPMDSYVVADQLKKLCSDYKWSIMNVDNRSIRIITSMNLTSWGEQIILLFDSNGIHINCIATPDARPALFTFGIRKENVELIRRTINNDL